MNKTLLAITLSLACTAVQAAEPVQISVRADQNCTAFLEPGHATLQSAFPDAEFIHKQSESVPHVQSCEIRVRKDAFLKAYSFCAMTSMLSVTDCSLSWNYASGRSVEFTAISAPGAQAARPAVCSFVCQPR